MWHVHVCMCGWVRGDGIVIVVVCICGGICVRGCPLLHALDSQEARLLSWSDAIMMSQGRLLLGSGDQELCQLLLALAFPTFTCLVFRIVNVMGVVHAFTDL